MKLEIVTAESMLLIAASKGNNKFHLGKGKAA
jgi:hypothetical protein